MGARGRLAVHAGHLSVRMTPATDYRLSILEALWGQPRSAIVRFVLNAGLDAITHRSTKEK